MKFAALIFRCRLYNSRWRFPSLAGGAAVSALTSSLWRFSLLYHLRSLWQRIWISPKLNWSGSIIGIRSARSEMLDRGRRYHKKLLLGFWANTIGYWGLLRSLRGLCTHARKKLGCWATYHCHIEWSNGSRVRVRRDVSSVWCWAADVNIALIRSSKCRVMRRHHQNRGTWHHLLASILLKMLISFRSALSVLTCLSLRDSGSGWSHHFPAWLLHIFHEDIIISSVAYCSYDCALATESWWLWCLHEVVVLELFSELSVTLRRRRHLLRALLALNLLLIELWGLGHWSRAPFVLRRWAQWKVYWIARLLVGYWPGILVVLLKIRCRCLWSAKGRCL